MSVTYKAGASVLAGVTSVLKRGPYHNINTDMDNSSDQDTISKLKFIAKLQKGEKINVRYMYIQPDGFVTRFSRTFINIDNRENTLTFIRGTIKRSFEIIKEYLYLENKDSRKQTAINIIEDLKQAQGGIQNLKHTYIEDPMFGSKMDTLMEDINSRITEIEKTEIYQQCISNLTPPLNSAPISPSSNSPGTPPAF